MAKGKGKRWWGRQSIGQEEEQLSKLRYSKGQAQKNNTNA